MLSDISNALNSASKTPERNCCIMIENVNMQNIGDYFSAFTDYANFPSEDHTLRFNDDVSLKLPQNLCFMLFPSSDSFTEELTPQLAHAGILVEIIAGKCAVKEGASDEIKVISRMDLEEIVGEAKEQFFVSENVWKNLTRSRTRSAQPKDSLSITSRFCSLKIHFRAFGVRKRRKRSACKYVYGKDNSSFEGQQSLQKRERRSSNIRNYRTNRFATKFKRNSTRACFKRLI